MTPENLLSELYPQLKHPKFQLPNPKFIIFVILALIIVIGLCCGRARASELNPILTYKLHQLEKLAQKENIHFKVTCGYRSKQEQLRLYAQGRTTKGRKITWTKHSKHNEGRAFDIVILINNKVSWKPQDYFRIGRLGKQVGLYWGGDWQVRDYCHFEI